MSAVTGFFLLMVAAIVVISVGNGLAVDAPAAGDLARVASRCGCRNTPWRKGKPLQVMGVVAFGCALAKELSGEAHLARAQQQAAVCDCRQGVVRTPEQIYVETTEKRFNGVKRCC